MAQHAYWVILAGATPTAFRASTRDVLVPTLRQLQRTQPDVTLRWFERGRLWESPEAARFGLRAKPPREPRGEGWRPGGDHRDPRARFELSRDERRARFKARARRHGPKPPFDHHGPDRHAPAPPPPAETPSTPHAPKPYGPPHRPKKPWSGPRPPRKPWHGGGHSPNRPNSPNRAKRPNPSSRPNSSNRPNGPKRPHNPNRPFRPNHPNRRKK